MTISLAVAIFTVNAPPVSPAVCALLLRPYVNQDGTQKNNFASLFRKSFNAALSVVVDKYKNVVILFIKKPWLTWATIVCATVLLVFFMNTIKSGLVPDEDQGVIFVNDSTAPGR